MSRKTFGQLITASKDYCIDDSTTSQNALSDSESFIKNEINNTVHDIIDLINNYKTKGLPKTMSTVADQIYYHYPPGLNRIESATMTVGSVDYPLEVVDSQAMWDQIQIVEYAASTIPKFIFPRQYDFGIYPTPQDAYTVTLIGNYSPIRMTANDYTTGTISISQNSQTVTGSSTTFTSSMVNRWLSATDGSVDNGNWYRISAFGSTTSLTLESYFEESALSGSTYIIGESPEIPEELHSFIPYRVAGIYALTRRRDPVFSQSMMNYYYTGDPANGNRTGRIKGGVLGIINRYKLFGRGNSQLVNRKKHRFNRFDETWSITLTGDAHGN